MSNKATTTPPAKRQKLDLTEDITVIVGDSKTRFHVQKCFLTKGSKFFKTCCEGDWKEGKAKIVRLPEADLDTFNTYLQWLYTGDLIACDEYSAADLTTLSTEDKAKAWVARLDALVDLAVLADQLDDTAFTNAITDAVILASQDAYHWPGSDQVCRIVAELPETSGIRKFTVDAYAVHVKLADLATAQYDLPTDFIFEVMMRLKAAATERTFLEDVTYQKRWRYHV